MDLVPTVYFLHQCQKLTTERQNTTQCEAPCYNSRKIHPQLFVHQRIKTTFVPQAYCCVNNPVLHTSKLQKPFKHDR